MRFPALKCHRSKLTPFTFNVRFPGFRGILPMLISILLIFSGCSREQRPPNFIIFIADDVSWNDLGCYGNTDVKTPFIDGLAAGGIRFNNTYLTASSCSPSRNSILLGRYPHNTGAAELHTKPPIHMLSLPGMLKNAGYHTVHSGKYHQGDYSLEAFSEIHRKMEDITNGGEGMWLDNVKARPPDKPFFMWFAALDAHRDWGPNEFSGTHDPGTISPPDCLAGETGTHGDLASYYDEIHRFDHHIGLVTEELEKQGVLDNTLIIVMGDNGRPFPHSKTRVTDRGMKTPFILHWPAGMKGNKECDALVSVIDIAPTLLELAGVSPPESFQGKSFASLLQNPGNDFRNYVFAEHNWHDYEAHERMVRDADHMYILNSRPQFPQLGPADAVGSPSYRDLDSLRSLGKLSPEQADIFRMPRTGEEFYYYPDDPEQWNNLVIDENETGPGGAHLEALDKLRSVLRQWMTETADNIPDTLTHSWYEPLPGYLKTTDYQVRGEMPGSRLDAIHVNRKGPF